MPSIRVGGTTIGGGSGSFSWSSYWEPQSYVVENAAPTNIVLTYDKATTLPDKSMFTCTVDSISDTVNSVSLSADKKTLTVVLATAVRFNQTVALTINDGTDDHNITVTNNVYALAETEALIDNLDVDAIPIRKQAINNLIYRLKNFTTDIWAGLDILRVGCAYSAVFSRQNWKENDHNETVVGSPTWTSDQGYTFNGSSQYGRSDFIPSTDAEQMTQNSATMFKKVSGFAASASQKGFGGAQTGGPDCIVSSTNAASYSRINTDAGGGGRITGFLTSGWIWLRRMDSLNEYLKINGVENTKSYASTGLYPRELGEMIFNNAGAFNVGWMEGVEEVFGVGRYFTDAECAEIEAAVAAYVAICQANPNTFPLSAVTGVAAIYIPTGIRLFWTDSGSYDNEIWAKVNSGTYELIDTVSAGVEQYDLTGYDVDDVLTVKIRAVDGSDVSKFTKVTKTISEVVHFQSIQSSVVNNVSIAFLKTSGTSQIYWGYGTTETNIENGTLTSNYPSGNATYDIYISGDLDGITSIACQNEQTVKVNVEELWKLTALSVCIFNDVYNYMDGALEGMPSTLTRLTLSPKTNSYGNPGSNQCTLSDPLFTWPVGLTELVLGSLAGNNPGIDSEKIFFDIEDLPATLTYLNISQAYNQNYGITGDESNMPPNMEKWLTQGCWGLEWSGGELPASLTEWYNENVNDPAFTGDLNTKLPVGLTKLFLVGNAAIASQSGVTGTMAGIASRCPDLAFIWVSEGFCYNLGSSLDPLAALTTLSIIVLASTGTKFSYSGGALPAWANTDINLGGKLTTAEVDSFLITYALTAGAGVKTITIADNNQARSSASDAAVATLQGLGKTVITN